MRAAESKCGWASRAPVGNRKTSSPSFLELLTSSIVPAWAAGRPTTAAETSALQLALCGQLHVGRVELQPDAVWFALHGAVGIANRDVIDGADVFAAQAGVERERGGRS